MTEAGVASMLDRNGEPVREDRFEVQRECCPCPRHALAPPTTDVLRPHVPSSDKISAGSTRRLRAAQYLVKSFHCYSNPKSLIPETRFN